MATECIGEEVGVLRRGQLLLNIEDLQKSTGDLFPFLLPPGLSVLSPKSADECFWALVFWKGSLIPKKEDLGALSPALGVTNPALDGFAFT